MDKINFDDVKNHPVHQAMVNKHKTEEKIRASKSDTIVVIQYGTGKTVYYTKKEALTAIIWDFDYIENVFYAEKGDQV